MPMPVYQPDNDLLGPIVQALKHIVTNQIPSVSRIYTEDPEGPLEHNSFLIPPPAFKVMDDTNGKIYLKFQFALRHVQRAGPVDQQYLLAAMYIMPYLKALTAWRNDLLEGYAIKVNITGGGFARWTHSNQPHYGLLINTEVETEFNIDTSFD